MLEVRQLTKRFGRLVVTDAVDLCVRATTCHALIGPNGAGKTTLLGQLGGQVLPDAGRILFEGQDITRWPVFRRARLGVARTFQINSPFRNLSVHENVLLGLRASAGRPLAILPRLAERRALQDKAFEILECTQLFHRRDELAARLSYGELRHLEIALALSSKPRLLLLDEPSAGMTRDEAGNLIGVIRSLPRSVAVILIEHDLDVVFALADQISVLDRGKVIACGNATEIASNAEVKRVYLGTGASS